MILSVIVLLATAAAIPLEASEPPVTDITFAPDGASLVAVSQAGVQVLSWPNLKRQKKFAVQSANLHCVVFSPSGNRIAVGGGQPSEQGNVEVFSWPEWSPLATVQQHTDSVTSIAWLDEEHVVSASLDRGVLLGGVTDSGVTRRFEGHSRAVTGLCLLNDQETLVSVGHDETLRVWKIETGRPQRSLSQHTKPIHGVAARPTSSRLPMVASAADDRTIRFWQPTIGRLVRYARLDAVPLSLAWTTDGLNVVAACADGHVRVIDPGTVTVIHDQPVIDGWAYAIAAHPTDGSFAVAGANGDVRRIKIPAR